MTDEGVNIGVWAIMNYNYDEYIERVYDNEIDALREVNGRGYGQVIFLPFGMDIREAQQK